MSSKGQKKAGKTTTTVTGKNPYARRRMIAGIVTVAFLIAYFVIPATGYEAIRLGVLIVFFLLITVCTLFQQQYRQWNELNRPRRK